MIFIVTYRGKDGALREEAIEAPDRIACVAECRKRGIAPTKIVEGGKGASRRRDGVVPNHGRDGARPSQEERRITGKAAILAAVVLAAIAGGVWWWLGRDEARPPQTEKPTKQKTAKPKAEKPAKLTPKPAETNAVPAESPLTALRREIAKLPREERERLAFEEMQKERIPLAPKTNRIFRTATEASMARIFMTRLGDPPPPFFTTVIPLRDEAHLAEILIANNPVLETDTEAQKASKEMVAVAKKEMIAYIKNGGNPEDFLKYYHGKLQEAFDLRRESARSFMSVARDDPSIAAEYLQRLNKELAEKGIREIELNEKQKKRFGLE